MDTGFLTEVLSSRVRLKIEDAIAVRPRTLGELSTVTGISVQGVLRHLKRLAELGLVEERKAPPRAPKARRVYSASSALMGDYSTADLMVVKSTEMRHPPAPGPGRAQSMESMAGEVLIQRRRVRDQARRLARMIDDLVSAQLWLRSALNGMSLGDEARLVLEVLLTEETIEDGVKALSRYYGIEDRRSIDKALAKAKRIVGK